jgi:hypothetical protein
VKLDLLEILGLKENQELQQILVQLVKLVQLETQE